MRSRLLTATLAMLLTLSGAGRPALALPTPAPTFDAASDAGHPPLTLVESPEGLTLALGNDPMQQQSAQRQTSTVEASMVQIGDVRLPGYRLIVTLREDTDLAASVIAAAQAAMQASVLWSGRIEVAAVPTARTYDGEPLPDLTRQPNATLPDSPLSVISEGRMRGVRLATLAISPIFQREGEVRYATRFTAVVPGARVVKDVSALVTLLSAENPAIGSTISGADACGEPSLQPVNADVAGRQAWRILVSHGGIQQLSVATLTAAGVPTGDLARLRIQHNGRTIAIRRIGSFIRFYAPQPGDRWNRTDTYWLTVEGEPGSPDMSERPAPTPVGSPNTLAIEHGTFINNKIYDAGLAGVDGDHWFGADLRPFGAPAAWLITPTLILPAGAGPTTITVTGAAATNTSHNFQFQSNGASAGASASGIGSFTATFSLSSLGPTATFIAQPVPGTPEIIKPDRVSWERPVVLNFNGNGAAFILRDGNGNYLATNTPAQGNDRLYDVTDPTAPVVVRLSGAPSDGNGQFAHPGGARAYVMAGAGALHNPAVAAYTLFPLNAALNKTVLYIAPNLLLGAIAPLVAHRNAQGYAAGAISAELIYDWWSFGQVSPDAIRNFLRYAQACWPIKPIAVTFVGDGSFDPRDDLGYNKVNLLPPYLAPVDAFAASAPEFAEAACDLCYAQLDGSDPLSDRLPDLLFGRLPARSAAELTALVNKIIAYENAPLASGGDAVWRSRIVYLADNFRLVPPEAPSGVAYDPAGNFELFSEKSIRQQPKSVQIQRMYYDPAAADWDGMHEPNAVRAYQRVRAIYEAGAALINYIGHAAFSQLAVTDVNGSFPEGSTLLYLFDPDGMQNVGRLPIVLHMTCLTGAFHTVFGPPTYPVVIDTTLDERLVLAPNGAVAVWGSSGLGVTTGQEALQRGFYNALWSQASALRTVGHAAHGGYLELFAQSSGNARDSLRMFVLLGDPLTRVRVATNAHLPIVGK